MCMTVDFTNIRIEGEKRRLMTHAFMESIIHITSNMTCDEKGEKKEERNVSFSFVTNHKSYLHTRQYSY